MYEVQERQERPAEETEQTKAKRPYVSPRIEDIEVLTELALGSPAEGGGGFRDRIF